MIKEKFYSMHGINKAQFWFYINWWNSQWCSAIMELFTNIFALNGLKESQWPSQNYKILIFALCLQCLVKGNELIILSAPKSKQAGNTFLKAHYRIFRVFSVQQFPNEINRYGRQYLISLFYFLFHNHFQLSDIHTYFNNVDLVLFLLFVSSWTGTQVRTKLPFSPRDMPGTCTQDRDALLECNSPPNLPPAFLTGAPCLLYLDV